MQNKQLRNFTTGSIPRHLVIFSIPMFLGNLLQAFYNTVDSIWVGRFLGPNALAAVSVGFPIIFALIALVMGLTMASTILVSQYFGAQKHDQVIRTVNNSLLLLTILGTLVSVIGVVFRRPLLEMINTPPDIIEMAQAYLGVFMAGLVGMFLYNVTGAILRGLGDSRTPLRFLAYATIINIVLDPLFIFGWGPIPAMGVTGVALATVLAQAISAVLSLHYLYVKSGIVRYQPGSFKFDWQLTKLTFRLGLPAGLQQMLVSLSFLVVSTMVNSFGSVVVAGFGAGGRIDQFAFMPAMSISMAVSALVGQNLGAGKVERVYETVKWSNIMAVGITVLVSLVAIFIPKVLLFMFTKDQAVLDAGANYLRYMGFGYIPMALMFTIGGVLRGTGDTMATMVLTVLSLWVFRVPIAGYLSAMPQYGVNGIWLAITVSPFVGFILHYIYFKTGRWQNKSIVKQNEPEGDLN